jgi:hypothetical protein
MKIKEKQAARWPGRLRLACFAVLLGAVLAACQSFEGRAEEADSHANPGIDTVAVRQDAWESLSEGLLEAWGLSAFWQKNTEECGYLETRQIDGASQTWSSVATLERTLLPTAPGAPKEMAWHYRYRPERAAWPVQEGWFAAKPHGKPLSWTRSYPDSGTEHFGHLQSGLAYSQRSYSLPDGRSEQQALEQEVLLADQLPFLLRSLVFSEGKTWSFALHPLSRKAVAYLPKALPMNLTVDGSEKIVFQDQEYPCWLLVLSAGQQTVEKYWFDRRYPHVLVRWENVAGESRQLHYVRHHPLSASDVATQR